MRRILGLTVAITLAVVPVAEAGSLRGKVDRWWERRVQVGAIETYQILECSRRACRVEWVGVDPDRLVTGVDRCRVRSGRVLCMTLRSSG